MGGRFTISPSLNFTNSDKETDGSLKIAEHWQEEHSL